MKSLKKLIIPCAVLVVLIIGLVVYSVINSNNTDTPTEEELNVYSANLVDSITVEKLVSKDPTVTVKAIYKENESTTYEYICEDADSSVNYSQDNLSAYVSILSSYLANSIVSSDGNFAEYGLDNPEYRITVKETDGTTKVILLGDDTYDGSSCYFMIEGSQDVYSVAVMKKLYAERKTINFLSSQALNLEDDKLVSVKFERKSDNVSIKAVSTYDKQADTASYTITEPFEIKASDYFANLMGYICTLEISGYIDIQESELSKYGLDNPNYHFEIVLSSGETINLYISELLSGYYYGYIDGTNQYFTIVSSQITGLDTPLLTLIDSYIAYNSVASISSYTVSYNGEEFKFEMEVKDGEAISAPDSKVTLNQSNAKIANSSGRTYCAILFESLACINIGGVEVKDLLDSYTPEITMTIVTNDYSTITYEFVKRNADSYYVYQNGKYTGFYILNKEFFHNGGQDTYDYGVWDAYQLLNTAIKNNINGIYDIPVEN